MNQSHTPDKPMPENERIALLNRVLMLNLGWVGAADAKIAPALAIDTGMLGVIAALIPKATGWLTVPAVLAALAATMLLTSLGCLVAAAFPRLAGPRGSLVYFGGIASLGLQQYVDRVKVVVDAELVDDLASQVHRNAEIAQIKFSCVRAAFTLLFIAIPFWLASVAFLYAIRR